MRKQVRFLQRLEPSSTHPNSVGGQDKIGGYSRAKEDIDIAVFLPIEFPHLGKFGFGWSGILLHGVSGTGKTALALSIAKNSRCTVFRVLSSDIVDKYVGAMEGNIRALFLIAQQSTPWVIFIGEVDALFTNRKTKAEGSTQRLQSELLSAIAPYSKVLMIDATNLPWDLDTAFPRRFDRHIHVAVPTSPEYVEILKLKLSDCLHKLSDEEIFECANSCDGFTGDAIQRAVGEQWMAGCQKMTRATTFRKIDLKGRTFYCPCSTDHANAEALELAAISNQVYPEPITAHGMKSAIKSASRTVAITKAA